MIEDEISPWQDSDQPQFNRTHFHFISKSHTLQNIIPYRNTNHTQHHNQEPSKDIPRTSKKHRPIFLINSKRQAINRFEIRAKIIAHHLPNQNQQPIHLNQRYLQKTQIKSPILFRAKKIAIQNFERKPKKMSNEIDRSKPHQCFQKYKTLPVEQANSSSEKDHHFIHFLPAYLDPQKLSERNKKIKELIKSIQKSVKNVDSFEPRSTLLRNLYKNKSRLEYSTCLPKIQIVQFT